MRIWAAAALLALSAAPAWAQDEAPASPVPVPPERTRAYAEARAALARWTSATLAPFTGEADIRAYFKAADEARHAIFRDPNEEQEILLVEPRQGPLGSPPLRLAEPGVERGDIVRQAGRFLIALRRGRLHSIDMGAGRGGLALADRADPGGPMYTIYDSMLVRGRHVIIVGLSRRGGVVSLFRVGADGRLTRQAIYLFSAWENYQAAIVGEALVLYGSTNAGYWGGSDPDFAWPSVWRWDQVAADRRAPPVLDEAGEPVQDDGAREEERAAGPPHPLVAPDAVYRPVASSMNVELHVISVCPLATLTQGDVPRCRSTAFAAPVDGHMVHLTATDAFVAAAWGEDDRRVAPRCGAGEDSAPRPMLWRVPLGGGPPGLLALPGTPLRGDSVAVRNGRIHAIVEPEPRCGAAIAEGRALFSAPLAAFARTPGTSGRVRVEQDARGDVAAFAGSHFALFNDHSYASDEEELALVPLDSAGETSLLNIPHGIIRAEPALGGLIVAGEGQGATLGLTFVSLAGSPRPAATARLEEGLGTGQAGATLTAAARRGGGGLIGLPAARRAAGADDPPLQIAYFGLDGRSRLRPLGTLSGRAPVDRICQPTCRTWLDEGRAIFVEGRMLALADTMIIEARVAGGRIVEVGRLDLATAPARSGR